MNLTDKEYDEVVAVCRELFVKKMNDYGTAWRILRPKSITDQIFIKAQRIRSIEDKGTQKVSEGISSEFIGIVNYSVMALIQLELNDYDNIILEIPVASQLYDKYINLAKDLMQDKNHDYGEAWRDMRISSLTDIILMKIFRTKQIEDNEGVTQVSEGVDANYFDMINYAVFALIKINEEKTNKTN
ncbi:MAG TPA: DUF1599 domain-containing protein [Bacteroidales bacterium]|nr:DUF1599 domain-containing protein [Bacteroidales bacterium]